MPWKKYRRTNVQPSEMRPYIPGEDLNDVSINPGHIPIEGDMISRNPDEHFDQWLVSKEYFEKNLEEIEIQPPYEKWGE